MDVTPNNVFESFFAEFKLKGIPSYFFLFLKKIVHDPTRNKLYCITL